METSREVKKFLLDVADMLLNEEAASVDLTIRGPEGVFLTLRVAIQDMGTGESH